MAQLSATQGGAVGRRATHPLLSALLVLGGAALFGTVGTAQALGPDVSTTSLAAARMLVAAVVFAGVAVLVGRGSLVGRMYRHGPVWTAGIGQGAFNLFFLAAMKEAGVAVGTLVAIGAAPVITGLLARHVTRAWVAATTVAVAGLALLVGGQGRAEGPTTLGVALALGAAASYATYIVSGNAAEARGLPTQPFLAAAFSISALVTSPWLLLGDLAWTGTAGGAALLAYLTVMPTLLAYSLFNRGLRGVRASTASTLALIEPVVAAGLAYALLGERLGTTGVLGAGMILLGLLLIVRTAAAAEKTSQPA